MVDLDRDLLFDLVLERDERVDLEYDRLALLRFIIGLPYRCCDDSHDVLLKLLLL